MYQSMPVLTDSRQNNEDSESMEEIVSLDGCQIIPSNAGMVFEKLSLDMSDGLPTLHNHLPQIISLVHPGIIKTLLENSDFLSHIENNTQLLEICQKLKNIAILPASTELRLIEELKQQSLDNAVVSAYFDYNLRPGRWPDPWLLQALAKIQQVHLCLWKIEGNGERVPHPAYCSDSIQPATQRLDLLYEDNDQVAIIEFTPRPLRTVLKEILTLSIPYTFNGLLINGSFFVNSLVFAELSQKSLAASSLVSSTQLLTTGSAKAMLASTSVVAARNTHDDKLVGTVLQQSWLQSIILSLPIITLYGLSKHIFLGLGQDAEIATIAGEFLLTYSLALPAVLLTKSNELFAMATKHQNIALCSTAINNTLTAFLTYTFALGKFGLPKLGIRGAAYGVTLATWASFIGSTLYFRYDKKNFARFELFHLEKKGRKEIIRTLFSVGFPMSLQVGIEFLYIFAKSIFAGILGENSLAAEQIVSQYSSLILSAAIAIGTVDGILVGRDVALNNSLNVKKIGHLSILLSLAVPAAGLVLFSTLPQQLTQVFIGEDEEHFQQVLALTKQLFIVNGLTGLLDAVKYSSVGALRGFYDTSLPAIIMLAALWLIGVPSSYFFSTQLSLGITGVFIGRLVASMTTTPILLDRWRRKSDNPQAALKESQASLINNLSSIFSKVTSHCQSGYRRLLEASPDNEELHRSFAMRTRCIIS